MYSVHRPPRACSPVAYDSAGGAWQLAEEGPGLRILGWQRKHRVASHSQRQFEWMQVVDWSLLRRHRREAHFSTGELSGSEFRLASQRLKHCGKSRKLCGSLPVVQSKLHGASRWSARLRFRRRQRLFIEFRFRQRLLAREHGGGQGKASPRPRLRFRKTEERESVSIL